MQRYSGPAKDSELGQIKLCMKAYGSYRQKSVILSALSRLIEIRIQHLFYHKIRRNLVQIPTICNIIWSTYHDIAYSYEIY